MKNVIIRPRLEAIMSSAILAAPGAETGETLDWLPVHFGVNVFNGNCKIQLRVYLSSVLKKPENVLIMRHVFAEELHRGHGHKFVKLAEYAQEDMINQSDRADLTAISVPEDYLRETHVIDYEDFNFESIRKLARDGNVQQASALRFSDSCAPLASLTA